MKKLLLIASLATFSFASTAQNQPQIPNGNFETWAMFSGCDNVDSAAHFSTTDETLFLDADFCISEPTVSKSTDSHSGTYALKMVPLKSYNPETKETIYYGSNFSTADTVGGHNIKFTGRPSKLKGFYKLNAAGDDALTIYVTTFNTGDEDGLTGGIFSTKTSKTEYTPFEIVLEYDETFTGNPDSLSLTISLSNEMFNANEKSMVLIDDLTFEYATTTATTNYAATSTINVFAANKNINFSENVSDVHVVDMTGVNALLETASTKQVNAANLKNGLYVVTYKFNDNYYSKKIVLE